MKHREDVQGLRAVAILSVLLFHFFPVTFPNGFLGVDIFFVISGYLILMILAHSEEKACGVTASLVFHFYYRRVKRILPLHLLYCISAIVVFSVMASPTAISESRMYAIYALTFATNIRSLFEKNDYFERLLDENLFTHIWSLSVEMQFYIIVPFFFVLRSAARPGSALLLLPTVSILSLVFYVQTPPLIGFNLPIARLWQFFAVSLFEKKLREAAAATGAQEPAKEGNKADETHLARRSSFAAVGQIAYLISLVLLSLPFHTTKLPTAAARIAVTYATALLIAFGAETRLARWLSARSLVFIGDISYSLYLIHWPFSVYLARDHDALSSRLSAISLSIVLTVVVYYVYERHYRVWSKSQIGWNCGLLLTLAALALTVAPALNDRLHRVDITIEEAIKKNLVAFSKKGDNLLIKECSYKYWRNMTEATPTHVGHIVKPYGICEMPPGTGKLRFAVIGNSYAPNQADLVWKHFKPYFSTFTLFSQCSCEVFTYTRSPYCNHLANFTDVLDDLKPDVTFIIQRHLLYGRPKERPPPPGKPDLALQEMIEHLRDIENKTSLFFVMDTFPALNFYKMTKMNDFIRAGKSEDFINNVTTLPNEDLYGRPRTMNLMQACHNCILYDVEPALLDRRGHFASYDGRTRLALFDPTSHLVPAGRQRIEPIYEQLARKYASKLRELEKRLYTADQP